MVRNTKSEGEGGPTSEVRDFALAAAKQGKLIRKSFEYAATRFDFDAAERRATQLRVKSSGPQNSNEMDVYWAREHAMAQLFRDVYGMRYEEYLPGRVYTYRALFNRLRESIALGSIIDVGCGSGMILHEACRNGVTAAGIDYSKNALAFARYLEGEFQTENLTLTDANALSDWTPPLAKAEVVVNLGALEHLDFADQERFCRYMAGLSKKYVVLSVPNHESRLFKVMEDKELGADNPSWIYPDERRQFNTDYDRLAAALDWTIVRKSFVHIADTTLTGDGQLGNQFNTPGEAIDSWLQREINSSEDVLASLGWFSYAIFLAK